MTQSIMLGIIDKTHFSSIKLKSEQPQVDKRVQSH